MNHSTSDGGSHWLTLSNINCLENTIKVYDSAHSGLSHEEELTIASLVATTVNKLQVIFLNVALQTNGYDCGLYTIAKASALRFGRDPTTQTHISRMMRSHLYKCLENKHLKPFPITNSKPKRKQHRNVLIYLYFVFAICQTLGHFIVIPVAMSTIHNALASTEQYWTQPSLPVQIVENKLSDYAKQCLFVDILIKL